MLQYIKSLLISLSNASTKKHLIFWCVGVLFAVWWCYVFCAMIVGALDRDSILVLKSAVYAKWGHACKAHDVVFNARAYMPLLACTIVTFLAAYLEIWPFSLLAIFTLGGFWAASSTLKVIFEYFPIVYHILLDSYSAEVDRLPWEWHMFIYTSVASRLSLIFFGLLVVFSLYRNKFKVKHENEEDKYDENTWNMASDRVQICKEIGFSTMYPVRGSALGHWLLHVSSKRENWSCRNCWHYFCNSSYQYRFTNAVLDWSFPVLDSV